VASVEYRRLRPALAGAAAVIALLLPPGTPSAQTPRVYLNPVVEALAQGKTVFGVSTTDLSLSNATALAGHPAIDYVYLDMEHNPLQFDQMKHFLAFVTAGDKTGLIKRGTGQVRPAVFARFPPPGREETQWMVKHALDIGLSGVLSNNIETPAQAEQIVRTMRPNPRRGSTLAVPRGSRGTVTCGFWAAPADCRAHADLWPLNPDGDLLIERRQRLNTGAEQPADRGALAPSPGVQLRSPHSPAMDHLEASLRSLTLAPYIVKATALIGVRRRSGSNMFRHQLATMAILFDYKIMDPVLLKASVIHDLFEDAPNSPGVTRDEIVRIDADGPAVYDLVMEVTIRSVNGVREPKSDYLLRIMTAGSARAKLLKLADRISNLTSLGFVHDAAFVRRYIDETRRYVLPYAEAVSPDMFRELSDLVDNRAQSLALATEAPGPAPD
jgi:GTP pyrophosphokinase